jgi:hypothetical protein
VETSLEDTSQEGGVSQGFCLLAQTLMSAHAQLGSSMWKPKHRCRLSVSVQPTVDMPIRLGNPMGSGAFSDVFELIQKDGKNNVFVKVPKSYQLKNSLVIEARALKVLAVVQMLNLIDMWAACLMLTMISLTSQRNVALV